MMYCILSFLFIAGKTNLRSEEEEPRVGEIQICFGLQNQGVEETDRTT